ncbi:hypothetical protein ACFX2I_006876 [Malus domestica]
MDKIEGRTAGTRCCTANDLKVVWRGESSKNRKTHIVITDNQARIDGFHHIKADFHSSSLIFESRELT